MMSEETTLSLTEQAITELQALTLNLYTPMTREEWERNKAIYDKVWEEVVDVEPES